MPGFQYRGKVLGNHRRFRLPFSRTLILEPSPIYWDLYRVSGEPRKNIYLCSRKLNNPGFRGKIPQTRFLLTPKRAALIPSKPRGIGGSTNRAAPPRLPSLGRGRLPSLLGGPAGHPLPGLTPPLLGGAAGGGNQFPPSAGVPHHNTKKFFTPASRLRRRTEGRPNDPRGSPRAAAGSDPSQLRA